jgi:hypothetical protein
MQKKGWEDVKRKIDHFTGGAYRDLDDLKISPTDREIREWKAALEQS